ncbi:MAG TPA: YihY/virulence factor BrkB family protein [Egicoccus sp.]|nr:YihY/virulence factor BrkB family protein [Egicoccus sp.]HSK24397.1 YihY/virulence factor BrkB family protein [Egicoccus sp.]
MSAAQAARTAIHERTTAALDRLPPRPRNLVRRLANRDLMAQASSLAFYGLVSALPLIMLTLAAVSAVAGEQAVQRFVDQASASGPDGSTQFLEQLARSGGSFTLATVVFTLWPATAYGGGLRRALARASGQQEDASGLRGRLRAIGLVLLLPVLMLAGLPMMLVLTGLSGDGAAATVLGWTIALVGATVVGSLITAGLYQAFSPEEIGWRSTGAGALLTATTTALFSAGFVVYLRVADTEERFGGGTIAIVVMLGLWLFVANALLLAGYHAGLELDGDLDGPTT